MAAESETAGGSGEQADGLGVVKPSLRIEGIHIEKLRAIRRLDWPGDGPGWGGRVPDVVLVGGGNGSGKTTLLDLLAGAWGMLRWNDQSLRDRHPDLHPGRWWTNDGDAGAWVDFALTARETGAVRLRYLMGSKQFVERNSSEHSHGFIIHEDRIEPFGYEWLAMREITDSISEERFPRSSIPSLIYIPSRARNLTTPSTTMKRAGKRAHEERFLHRWEPPKDWGTSLEALLYSARWEDLNAKEEGRPEDAHHFDNFARAYEAFFGTEKRLSWHKGELFVEIIKTGALHDLARLSSGEQQIVVLISELLDRWRPGSLILIDEPELHLHVSWQFALWDALSRWREERGGQVIATTQSTELFGYSEPGTNVILGGRAP